MMGHDLEGIAAALVAEGKGILAAIHQTSSDVTPLAQVLSRQGILPGIKIDTGAKPLAGSLRRNRHPGGSMGFGNASRNTAAWAPVSRSSGQSSISTTLCRAPLPSTRTRTRWRGMLRSAKDRTSFRSSSRKC
jgi:hypothetical protein